MESILTKMIGSKNIDKDDWVKKNIDKDDFHHMEFNVYLLLIQIMVWFGLACEGEDSKEKVSKDQA
jgi:hypothetical protein